ncbi:MAG: tetratricopeptide repeat protein [Xanthomonadales bacterium]|nr:tetratricopeptide repeat protein [Gammaproteobacteria bacterium]MBT8065588.1 tetratricopeptide repeat protein [Gammaproteobacteria bacterium]NNK33335.1 tetratricopeptide repeat protein [Xanthomonadales bacterium]NNK37720.1 tetratricopeptide repeat protein [Xanthomonadales bacterium]
MVEIYDAHEQGEVVKKWLKENGSAIVMGLVLAFGGLFGFKQWQGWQETNKQQASTEFEVMNELLSQNQLDAAMSNFQTLQDDYSKSPYASMAALQMAKQRLEANQPDLAIGLYEYVMENGYPAAMALVARERLARVLLDQGRADEAMQLLDAAGELSGFESRFAEVRGDIHYDQGRLDQAEAAYLEALEALESGVGDRSRLVLKLEAMGATIPEDGSQS